MNSKRFRPSAWLKWLVPLLLAMLLLGLLTTLIIIGMSLLGIKFGH
jgi:uncharacterized membrane protein